MVWVVACADETLREEEPFAFRIADKELAVCRVGPDLLAFDNVCTHQHAFLSDGYVEDGCIECPLHQGRFDMRTGAALGPIVCVPIKVYGTKVDDGQVMVDIG